MAVQKVGDAAFAGALAENEKVIVKFYADWCGSCRLFAPKYNRMAGEEAFSDVVFLDVNAEESPEARKLAAVDNLPFFAVFKNGRLVEGCSTSREEYVREMLAKLD